MSAETLQAGLSVLAKSISGLKYAYIKVDIIKKYVCVASVICVRT